MNEELTEEVRQELELLEGVTLEIERQYGRAPDIAGLYSLSRARGVPLAEVLRAAASPGSAEMRNIVVKPAAHKTTACTWGRTAQLQLRERMN